MIQETERHPCEQPTLAMERQVPMTPRQVCKSKRGGGLGAPAGAGRAPQLGSRGNTPVPPKETAALYRISVALPSAKPVCHASHSSLCHEASARGGDQFITATPANAMLPSQPLLHHRLRRGKGCTVALGEHLGNGTSGFRLRCEPRGTR